MFSRRQSPEIPENTATSIEPFVLLSEAFNREFFIHSDFESSLSLALLPHDSKNQVLLKQMPISTSLKGCLAVIASAPDLISDSNRSALLSNIKAERASRADGYPILIVVVQPAELAGLGTWMINSANSQELVGLRLALSFTGPSEPTKTLIEEILTRLTPINEPSVVSMPVSPELERSPLRHIFAISPELRRTLRLISDYAENGISRVFLLGAPGTGKSTLAYYYFLKRKTGNFVQINLTSESTGDKASMKSLLCGHVSGAFPGAGTREGALSFARDGVCFLDESHGMTGVVMQVLMEVLDSGQFLPFGATAKRPLECAVLFASNRSWEAIRSQIHLDEYARLGATLLPINDLISRPEDLIAVAATTLAKFAAQVSTWPAPTGVSAEAWRVLTSCPFRGNVRSLMRTIETACVEFGSEYSTNSTLDVSHIKAGLSLWEPEEHPDIDQSLFVSINK